MIILTNLIPTMKKIFSKQLSLEYMGILLKEYDLISIGTGSAMSIVDAMIRDNPRLKVAVIDKDEPGGICLTKGCIPSKMLLYPAELVRTIDAAHKFGIDITISKIDYRKVMERIRFKFCTIGYCIDFVTLTIQRIKNTFSLKFCAHTFEGDDSFLFY